MKKIQKNNTQIPSKYKQMKMMIILTIFSVVSADFLPTDVGDGYFISYNKEGVRNEDIKVSEVANEFILRKKNLK